MITNNKMDNCNTIHKSYNMDNGEHIYHDTIYKICKILAYNSTGKKQ